jgi:hypothetical protein
MNNRLPSASRVFLGSLAFGMAAAVAWSQAGGNAFDSARSAAQNVGANPGALGDAATSAGSALGSVAGAAQNGAGGAGGAPAAAVSSSTANNSNSIESNTMLTIIDKAFNVKTDEVDPENGTMVWHGHTYDLGQSRIFKSQFERYLSLPPTKDEVDYEALIDQIDSLLSAQSDPNDAVANVHKAWNLLYDAAKFEGDDHVCENIAQQVFNSWRSQDEAEAQRLASVEADRLRVQQQPQLAYVMNAAEQEGAAALASAGQTAMMNASSLTPQNLTGGSSTPAPAPANPSPPSSTGTTSGNSTSGSASSASGSDGGGGTTSGPYTILKDDHGAQRIAAGPQQHSSSAPSIPLVGAGDMAIQARTAADLEIKVKTMQASALLTGAQAKVQFQTEIVSLFLARRFQHCLIACEFYQSRFKSSAQDLDEKFRKDLVSFFGAASITDMPLTIDSIQFLSQEAVSDTKKGMESVNSNFDDHQTMAALERLEETFFLGEYLPAVSTFEKEKRDTLYQLYRLLDNARKLADEKDFEELKNVNQKIGAIAPDFHTNQITSYLQSLERMSSIALSGAMLAAANGDRRGADDGIREATSIWPLNPDIDKYSQGLRAQTDLGSRGDTLFDDAMKRGDLRTIYEHAPELSIALGADPSRLEPFKDVVKKMTAVEMYLEQEKTMAERNNSLAAWEMVANAAELAPNDVEVNKAKADLAPRVAGFAGKLDQAKRFEDQGLPAASLAQYLAAQEIYPASEIAKLGIDRVSRQLMDELRGESAPASGGSASSVVPPANTDSVIKP